MVHKIKLNELRDIVKKIILEGDDNFEGDKSILSDYLGRELKIERDDDGLLNFNFDANGWLFDTRDVGEGCSIILGSKYKNNVDLRKLTVTDLDKLNITPIESLYWLSGGNAYWKFGDGDFEEFEGDLHDNFNNEITEIVKKSNTLGEIIDGFGEIVDEIKSFVFDRVANSFDDLDGDYTSDKAKLFFKNNLIDSIYDDNIPYRIIKIEDKYNFIDEDGNLQIERDIDKWFDDISEISNKEVVFCVRKGNKYAVVDKYCDSMFNYKGDIFLDSVGEFNNEEYCVISYKGKFNYLSLKGETITFDLSDWFESAEEFKHGKGLVRKDGDLYDIDVDGKLTKR